MTKKIIKMTETDVNKIVDLILTEGSETVERFEKAYGILKDACESGYIPFVNPNQSDTDNEIKNAILEVMLLIAKACYLDRKLYGNDQIANVV